MIIQSRIVFSTRPMALLMVAFFLIVYPLHAREFYVASDGNNNNSGTIDYPFKTISKAVDKAMAGDIIWVRGGLHGYDNMIRIDKDGSEENLITLQAYQNEVPVLDFQNGDSSDRGINLKGNYWHIKGLVLQHAGDNGVIVYGAHNCLEQLVACENGDSGIQLHTGAAHNLIKNCDSYLNYDPRNNGENADGFAAKFDLGEGNRFVGCRAWGNSDDGYDFWEAGNGVTLEACWAFGNGINIWDDPSFRGDGNGFKLGYGTGAHILIRCVAYGNPNNGIDVNGNQTGVTIYNCTCAGNTGPNFYFDEHSDVHVLRNNLSHLGRVRIYDEIDDDNNSWNGFDVEDTDFRSLDPNGMEGLRDLDGSLSKISFLRLAADSPLIDAGVDVNIPYQGTAPDLGAFEHLEGDYNGDSTVDYFDLECLTAHWLDSDCGDCNGIDLDGNEKIDFFDFSILASKIKMLQWSNPCDWVAN